MFPYALTILIGSTLLFLIEPMIARYILPWFGGGPSVWSTCMLFFQLFLLGGYAYAHWIGTALRPRKQAMVHLALLAVSLAFLPITPSETWKPADPSQPALHIIALLARFIGLPFALLASSSVLHQYWFSRACPKRSPYWLYSLSNVGSVLGLLAYPFLLEPKLGLDWQTWVWSGAYGLFILSSGWCAMLILRQGDAPLEADAAPANETETRPPALPTQRLGFWRPMTWIVLAACGSMMLIATTNQMCAEVAVIPFLWILPLSLYLLSFILCFGAEWWYHRGVWGQVLLLALSGVLWLFLTSDTVHVYWQLSVLSLAMLAGCMICHGEMVRLKPGARHLTAFYLMISVGGALGGIFVNFAAPYIFSGYWEFHIGLFLSLFLFGLLVFRGRGAGEWVGWLGAITLAGLLGRLLIWSERAQGSLQWLAHSMLWIENKLLLNTYIGLALALVLLALLVIFSLERLRWPAWPRWTLTAVLGGGLGWWFVNRMEHSVFSTFPPITAYNAIHDYLATFGKQAAAASATVEQAAAATTEGRRLTILLAVWLLLFILAIATPPGRALFRTRWLTGWMRAGWLGCLITLAFFLLRNIDDRLADAIDTSRNFYGVLRVVENNKGSEDEMRALYHGPIEHGNEYMDEARHMTPTTYYSAASGISMACRLHPKRKSGSGEGLSGGLNLGVVGLGTGTSACMAGPRDTIRFYEINPEIIRIAMDKFFYLKECKGKLDISKGDARISLERELSAKPGKAEKDRFDVLALDAFNGDAIPVHLLTRESFKMYWQHLRPDGIMAVNISNLHLNLGPVVKGLAEEIGKKMVLVANDEDNEQMAYVTDWALVTSNEQFLNLPEIRGLKESDQDTTKTIIWTDQYSNLVSVLKGLNGD